MNVLVIDDNIETCELICMTLQPQGYTVRYATTAARGMELFHEIQPALCIIDIHLPEANGRDLCQEIRETSDVPILMISAIAKSEMDVVAGLDIGADDYLLKPIKFPTLAARVHALLRRRRWQEGSSEDYSYADPYLCIDLNRKRVMIEGVPLHFTGLEFDLLKMLVERKGSVVSAEDILNVMWPSERSPDRMEYLYSYIARLRQKIEPDPSNPRYIVSAYGSGYRFVSPG